LSVKTFAAIDIGSFEVAMKIFEFSGQNSMREIDHVRTKLDLGTDAYGKGKLSNEKVDELCRVLKEFSDIMKTYKVEAYQAYGTSAIREAANTVILLDRIAQRTGIRVGLLSNSEQRLLDYKSIASRGEVFRKIIEEKTAIVDIGGGSIQISLFDSDTLVSTQNLRIGVMRIQERLNHINAKGAQFERIIDEIVTAQLSAYKKLYLKEREIQNLIIVDDYISLWALRKAGKSISRVAGAPEYEQFMESLRTKSLTEVAMSMDIPEEKAILVYVSAILLKRIIRLTGAQRIWAPGVTLSDGIGYEYAEKKRLLKGEHNFEKDIVACAVNISKRYMGSRKQAESIEKFTLAIFDSVKKLHGLGKRERLYLQIAAILCDCGKFISLINIGENSYNIIMATEIIGLSHMEREIVANVARFSQEEFVYYEHIRTAGPGLEKNAYLTVAKLTAILKLACTLNLSGIQKFKEVKVTMKEELLFITVETLVDITLEKRFLEESGVFFKEVFSVSPIIKQKKVI